MVNKDKDPYTEEVFEGAFANDQFMKERFEKETYMCVVNEQDSQFPGSHSVMVYEDKKKTSFRNSLGRYFSLMASNSRDPFTKYPEDYNI